MGLKKKKSNENDLDAIRPQPLYQKVKEFIRGKIESDDWSTDARIPSENELVKSLKVSRMTIHRALRELTAEGCLVRIQGVGTFVSPRKQQSALLKIRSIADEIIGNGKKHTSYVHLLGEEQVPKDVSQAMNLNKGALVFHSIIVHSADDIPVQLSDRYVNPMVAPNYLHQDFTRITPNHYLIQVAPISEVEHIIEAELPDPRTQKLLKIKSSEPCLVLNRRTWVDGIVATKSRFFYPGTRYRLGSRFKPQSKTSPLVT